MRSCSRLVLLAALAGGARGARHGSQPYSKEDDDLQAKSGRIIHGQTVYPQDHILADAGEVTLIIETTSAQGALAALGAGREAVSTSNENVWFINVAIDAAETVMTKLEQNDGVKYVEFDSLQEVFLDHKVSGDQRYLRRLSEEQPYGIEMVLQDMTFWQSKFQEVPTGASKVCVVDTGYDIEHEDLPILNAATDGFSQYGQTWHVDGHGHGTHCAGSIGALGDNNKGVVGVIPSSLGDKFSFFIGKGLSDSGSGSSAGVMAAVQACVDNGANVVSMSLGGGPYSQAANDFYHGLYETDDVLIIAAAGNGGNSALMYPASYEPIMSVAAVNSNENRASFSQYNEQVEIAAPGVSVKSTLPDNEYAAWSGTSMATPHVAAVAGILRMYFPQCKAFQIRRALISTTKDKGESGCDVRYGFGIVQAKAAYQYLLENPCDPNAPFKEPEGGCAEFACSSDSDCNDGNDDTIDTCNEGTCNYACASDAACDDGIVCTTDTCENGVCTHADADGYAHVKVELTTDNYPSETEWTIKDGSGVIKLQGGPYSDASTLHESQYCTTESHEATFDITDSYGDGICCSYGQGGYKIFVDGNEEVSGGEFGDAAQETFSVVFSPTSPPVSPPTSPPVSPPTSPPVAPPTSPPVSPPTSPPVSPPTSPPVAPPVPAPTNPPVGGTDPVGTIKVDVFTVQFTFTPTQACVTPDIASPTGASEYQCAQACAYMDGCAGFVKPEEGDCVLSLGPTDDGCDETVLFYERSGVMYFD